MKKFVYLGLIALAAASTACSNDDDNNYYRPGDTKDRIDFGNAYVNKSVGQRDAVTVASLDKFQVWGFVENPASVVFDGKEVTKEGGEWRYNGLEYWYPAKNYYFTAIAPVDNNNGWYFTPVTTADDSYTGAGTIGFNNNVAQGESDLVYDFVGPQVYSGEGVPAKVSFTFDHLLSQIRAEFVNQMTATTQLEIEDVRFIGSPTTGTIDLTQATPVWELGAGNAYTPETTTLQTEMLDPAGSEKIQYQKSNASEGVFVIPSDAGIRYQLGFTVRVFNGPTALAEYKHVVTLPATALLMGRSYNFKAVLSPENINPDQQLTPIEFTVQAVNDWEDDDDIEIDLGNK